MKHNAKRKKLLLSLVALILVAVMLLGLTACGGKKAPAEQQGKKQRTDIIGHAKDNPVGYAIGPGIFADAQNAAIPC